VGHHCPLIFHSLFVDGLLIFCRASSDDVEELREYLNIYERWFGRKKNKESASIFGTRNASDECVKDLGVILQVKQLG